MLFSKQYLRKKFKNLIIQKTSLNILHNAQTLIGKNSKVAIYYPTEGEPNLLQIAELNPSIKFCLPKIINDSMIFTTLNAGEGLVNNKYYPHILESQNNEEIKPDIIFVPGLAFDIKGNRLGRGRGYYDKYIALNRGIKTIGVIFREKLVDSLPVEPHDYKMNYIITENLILRL